MIKLEAGELGAALQVSLNVGSRCPPNTSLSSLYGLLDASRLSSITNIALPERYQQFFALSLEPSRLI